MLTCRSTAERHRSLAQGYIQEHRLDYWFRGCTSRSALLESQESAGRKKYWLRRLDYRVCMLYLPRVSPSKKNTAEGKSYNGRCKQPIN